MRILIDISHPAHVHFFKNVIRMLSEREHLVKLASRDKDITLSLLNLMGFTHTPLSSAPKRKTFAAFSKEMIVHCSRLYKLAKSFKPDVMMQIAGTFITPVGRLIQCPTAAFYDTEFAMLSNAISYPLATCVCTPDCYEGQIRGKHIRYPGYHELAYLHPDVFKPNPNILAKNNLKKNEKFFIVRFVGWAAVHDYKEEGFDLKHKLALVDMLSNYGKVLISSEAPLPDTINKYRSTIPFDQIHDIMAYASLVIGESATMASEAAVLGVPAIFISTTPRGYTNEQDTRYGLVKNFKPCQQDDCLEVAKTIASRSRDCLNQEYQARRKKLLSQKINVSNWMKEFVESNFH